jgi:hypothetical protein
MGTGPRLCRHCEGRGVVPPSQTLLAQRLVVEDTMGAGLRPLDSSWSPRLGMPQSTCDLMLMTASEHYAAIEQQTSVS